MAPEAIHHLVVGTGRLSAAVFALALIAGPATHGARLWWAFVAAHTAHFAAVLWFAVANNGQDLFPGGRSLEDAGGWPTILASGTLFYVLARIALAGRRAASARWLRGAGSAAATSIGLMFLATYVPLVAVSALFALPAGAIAAALVFYLTRAVRQGSGRAP